MIDLTPNSIKIIPKKDKIQVPDTFNEGTDIGSLVGGWKTTSSELSKGNIKLQATAERILIGDATEPLTGNGIFLGKDEDDYEFRAGNPAGDYIHYDGINLTIKGLLEAGSIHIPDQTTADSFHAETDGDTYWGCNVADWILSNDNAKAWIKKDGTAKFQKITIDGGSDVVFKSNTMDTSAKEILGDFTFGASGAIKMITDANNGLWISPTGILGKKAGVNTFAIGTDGSAIFKGSIQSGSIITGAKIECYENSEGSTHKIIMGDNTYAYGLLMKNSNNDITIHMKAGAGKIYAVGEIRTSGTLANSSISSVGDVGLLLQQRYDCTESANPPILAKLEIDPDYFGQGQESYAIMEKFVIDNMTLGDYRGTIIDFDLTDIAEDKAMISNLPLPHSGQNLDNDIQITPSGAIQRKAFEIRHEFINGNNTFANSHYSHYWSGSGTGATFTLSSDNQKNYLKIKTDDIGSATATLQWAGNDFDCVENPSLYFVASTSNGSNYQLFVIDMGWYRDSTHYIYFRKKSNDSNLYCIVNSGSGETETNVGSFNPQRWYALEIRLFNSSVRVFVNGSEKSISYDPSNNYKPYFKITNDAGINYNCSLALQAVHIYRKRGSDNFY